MEKTNQTLLSHVRKFKSDFTKDNFNVLSKNHYWDHAIKLTLEVELKFSEVYLLFPIEQIE